MLNIQDLPKAYEAKNVENRIYDFWETEELFKANPDAEGEPYSIVIPPPNVTGVLHMGHALDGTLQDILVRYHRMMGRNTLWLPGTDHAGIATQNVVEKELKKEGKTRHDLGREAFLERTWQWANKHRGDILQQFKRLGASFDLSRERFTFDEGCSTAVKEVFVRLYNEGLIYKGAYIVNWCPRCVSAISDIETEYETEEGHLWEISYPLKDEAGAIVVATTRPETVFGDVAVAVNPNDYKYKDLIGKRVIIPASGRSIPIIADDYVEMGFGTGALKITPAHDPNDFEVGKRHGLKPLWIMDEEGNMVDNELVPEDIRGLNRYDARKRTLEILELQGALVCTKPHQHNVGHCQRCNSTIEPYLSEQWFVKMESLVKKPIEAIAKKELNFVPERWTKTYLGWMENIRDWCISRQLWWGHQIPAYYCQDCNEMMVANAQPEQCTKCSSQNIEQDEDVLDTWFSSALWPFSTMGWPDMDSKDLQKYYPTSTLVTGFDIIFFWVARMVVMGYKFTDVSPFKNVYIHGLIRDEKGQKMSKSKGNTLDPVEIIDRYGCDALRFTLTSLVTYGGQDIKISDERFEYGRNFANKLWNASRFTIMNLRHSEECSEVERRENLIGEKRSSRRAFSTPQDDEELTIADRWILSKLNNLTKTINENFENFRIGENAHLIYDFFRGEFCDWYLEMAKVQLKDEELKSNTQAVLSYCLKTILKLLHPIMPHITEEIWQTSFKGETKSIMVAEYPQYNSDFKDEDNKIEFAIDAIKGLRNIRQSFGVPASSYIKIFADNLENFKAVKNYIKALARVEAIEILEHDAPQSASIIVGNTKITVPLKGIINIDEEIGRQQKKLDKLEKELNPLVGRLSNEKFTNSAPEKVVNEAKEKVEALRVQKVAIEEILKSLKD